MHFDGERKRVYPCVHLLVDTTSQTEKIAIDWNKLSNGNWLHYNFKRFLAAVFPLCSCALCIHPSIPPQIWLANVQKHTRTHTHELLTL